MSAVKVTVVEVRKIENAGTLKAVATIKIGPMTFREFRVVQPDGQEAFVTGPQKQYEKRDGTKGYMNYLDYPKEWGEAIREAVLAEWEAQNGQ